jgi:hypothetical protein
VLAAGEKAAVDYRHGDGSNQLGDRNGGAPYSDWTGYKSVNTWDKLDKPLHWQPLCVPLPPPGATSCPDTSIQRFSTPEWGQVTPFALTRPDQFGPPAMDTNRLPTEAKALVDLQAKMNDANKASASYWADGPGTETPAGHWVLFAAANSRAAGLSLDANVKVFFAFGNAVLDSSIATWNAKAVQDTVRPISYIRWKYKGTKIKGWLGPGKGLGDVDGASWIPYQEPGQVTPPFAEYTSGHSAFSGAASEVFTGFAGTDSFKTAMLVMMPAGSSTIEPGLVPRDDTGFRFTSFTDAADQAGWSRRYGGIDRPVSMYEVVPGLDWDGRPGARTGGKSRPGAGRVRSAAAGLLHHWELATGASGPGDGGGGVGWPSGLDDGRVQPVADLMGKGHGDVGEASRRELRLVFGLGEGAGDAAHPGAPLGPILRRQLVLGDDVGDADAAAGLEDPEGLGEHRRLVGRQVDDAVGDHHIDRLGGQGDGLDVALEEVDVGGGAGLGGVVAGQGEHLLGHVQPVGLAGRADPLGGQEHVDAAARPEVKDGLARGEVSHGGRVAAAQAGQQGGVGQLFAIQGGVQLGAEPGLLGGGRAAAAAAVAAAVGRLATAAVALASAGLGGGGRVAGPDLLA